MRIEHHRGWTGARLFALAIVALTVVGLGLFGGAAKPALAAGCTFRLAADGVNGADYTATEGEGFGGGFHIVVQKLTASCAGGVNLTFASGTAVPPGDYTNPGMIGVFFNPGDLTQEVNFFPNDDAVVAELPETFTVTIAAQAGDFVTSPTTQTLTILDNDGPPSFSFSVANYPVAENAGSVTITVNRSGLVNQPVSVQYNTIDGFAVSPGDYTAIAATTLNFTGVQTSRTFTVSIANDLVSENAETFSVHLLNPSDSGSVGSDSTVTINDNDGAGSLQWTLSSYTTSEGAVTASFDVSRTGGSSGIVGATCSTTAGTASTVTDYNPIPLASGLLSWGSGDTANKQCQITILEDIVVDGSVTFGLLLSAPTGGAVLGAPSAATVTITDNDGTGNLQFSSPIYSVAENGVLATIAVTRSGGSGVVGVTYSTIAGGTAISSTEYTPVTSTLSWGAGDFVAKTFTVPILDDLLPDGSKTVFLQLSSPTGGATLGAQSSAVLTIADNESAIPIITSLSPTAGTTFGGTTVGIVGSNFTGATTVTFDGVPGTGLVVNSNFSITIVTPAHTPGTVEVVVINGAGSSSTPGTANDYTFTTGPTVILLSPNTGPASGTTFVTITGTNFTSTGLIVQFGGSTATANFIDAQTIIAVAPAHSAGTVDVIVTTAGGSSPNTVLDDYTYTGSTVPVVTGVSPASGPTGTSVIVSGSGFTGATLVTFGGVSATFTVNSDISISATVPVAAPGGTIDVRVTTPSGQSANTAADNYNNTSGGATTTYTLFFRWTLLAWSGIDSIAVSTAVSGLESPDNPATNNVSTTILVIWFWDGSVQRYLGNFPGSSAPGANDFTVLRRGNSYWIAVSAQVTWTVVLGQ